MVLIGVVVAVVLVTWLYLSQIRRSRESIEHLYDVPDDMKRAGEDQQQPPFDGSAGMV